MNEVLRLNLLGSPQILVGDQPLNGFATKKAQALLFYLAVTAHSGAAQTPAHSREALAALLWGEMTDVKAKQNLRAVLPDLRRHVGNYLRIDRKTIVFDAVRPNWLDVAVIQRDLVPKPELVDVGVRQTAVNLYQGEFLSGFHVRNAPAFESWVIEQREQYHILIVNALFSLVDDYLKCADYETALTANRRLLTLEPWSEPAHRQQMLLLAQTGERSAALAQFESCREILAAEFGVAPLAETVALFERIRAGGDEGQFESQQGEPIEVEQIVPETTLSPSDLLQSAKKPAQLIFGHDLPQQVKLFGRQDELARLQSWVGREGCRLACILGMGGQGKSILAANFVRDLAEQGRRVGETAVTSTNIGEQSKLEYQHIIWRSLLNAPPLVEVMQDWIYVLSGQTVTSLPESLDQQFSQLLDYLRRQRTLLVLDNVESILLVDGRSGSYRAGYEPYGQLIRLLANGDHHSCLLLTSRECPQEVTALAEDSPAARILKLEGLSSEGGRQMLQSRGLAGDVAGMNAIVTQYSGNPLALKLVAETVQEVFGGNISRFLQAELLVFDDIRDVLNQQFARLTPLERELLIWLAIVREPTPFSSLRDLLAQPPQAPRKVLEAVRSLQRRSLLEKHEAGFGLQNVVLEYISDLLIENMAREMLDDAVPFSYFNNFGLILAQTKAYVRASQRRLLLQAVADRLAALLGNQGVEKRLQTILARLQREVTVPGYAAANLLHLLLYMGVDTRGHDFSRLYLRQLYLRGVSLPKINFTEAEIVDSVFTEPFGLVYIAIFSPGGRYLAAGMDDGVIYVWRTVDQQLVQVIDAHSQSVEDLAFVYRTTEIGAKELLLASASSDKRIGIWSIAEREQDRWHTRIMHYQHKALMSVNFSPDGNRVTAVDNDGQVFVWDVNRSQDCQLVQQFSSTQTREGFVSYSGDSQTIAIGGRDATVQLRKLPTGELDKVLQVETGLILSVALSADGRTLATGGEGGHLCLWKLPEGELVQVIETKIGTVDALAFSPDGKTLASTHGGEGHPIRLWTYDAQVGWQLRHTLLGHTHVVWSVRFNPDSTSTMRGGLSGKRQLIVTASSDQTVCVWDVEAGQLLYRLNGQPRVLHDIAIRPLSQTESVHSSNSVLAREWLLAAVGYDQFIYLWEGAGAEASGLSHKFKGSAQALHGVDISPDGCVVASCGRENKIRLWQIANEQLHQTFQECADNIAFHPERNLLASGEPDGMVKLWEVRGVGSGDEDIEKRFSQDMPSAAIPGVDNMAFSPDGRFLACVGKGLSVRVWDVIEYHQPKLMKVYQAGEGTAEQDIFSVAFSPDRRHLAGGGNHLIHLWELGDDFFEITQLEGQEGNKHHVILRHHKGWVYSVAFSPDGTILASSSADCTVCLWDVAQGTLLAECSGHTGAVYKVVFTPDGRFVVSCSADGLIKFWDVETDDCVNTLHIDGPYEAMNIAGTTGITEVQKAALKALGAVKA